MEVPVTETQLSTAEPPSTGIRRLWDRQLPHYPDTAARTIYLAITVLITVALYYQLYVQGSVAPSIIAEYGFTFTEFVFVSVIGFAVGAFAALAAGLADRWGRANLVVIGLLLTGLLITFAVPNAPNKATYTASDGPGLPRRGRRPDRHSRPDSRLLAAARPGSRDGLLDARARRRLPGRDRGVE